MYHIEFLKPAVVDGREYAPFSHTCNNKSILSTVTGRRRGFKTYHAAVAWTIERFGVEQSVCRVFLG